MDYLLDYQQTYWLLEDTVSDHTDSCFQEATYDAHFPPLPRSVWDLYGRERHYIIINMEEQFLELAVDFVEKHFVKYDTLCRGVHLNRNKEALEYYRNLIRYWVQDRSSLLAIEEGNERLVGVLVAKMNYITSKEELEPRFSRIVIFNDRVQDIQNLRVNVRQAVLDDVGVEFVIRRYLEIKLFCVDRVEINFPDIEKRMLIAIHDVALLLKSEYIIAIMGSEREQNHLLNLEFTKSFEVEYMSLWKTKPHGIKKVIFPPPEEKDMIMGFYKIIGEPERKNIKDFLRDETADKGGKKEEITYEEEVEEEEEEEEVIEELELLETEDSSEEELGFENYYDY